jgi:hypothetical protein
MGIIQASSTEATRTATLTAHVDGSVGFTSNTSVPRLRDASHDNVKPSAMPPAMMRSPYRSSRVVMSV